VNTLQLTITLGDLIQIGATIAAIVIAHARIANRLTALEVKLDPLWMWFWKSNDRRQAPRE
jgi:hypothetical protein